jgi:general stress protein 26
MSEDLKNEIMDFMKKGRFCTLATVGRRSGRPQAATIGYETAGFDIYFATGGKTAKFRNIKSNPWVAIAIYYSESGAPGGKGLQYFGKAEEVSEKDFEKVPERTLNTYNRINKQDPARKEVIVKIKPSKILYWNPSKGFGHMDVLKF